jgi:uncharacterized membrane protein YfcA
LTITLSNLLLPLFGIFIASFLQSITGFGLAIIAAPLLMISFNAKMAILIILCIAFVSNLSQSIHLHKNINFKLAGALIAGSLIGQPFGVAIYSHVSDDVLELAVSIVILLFILLMEFSKIKFAERARNSLFTGIISGVMAVTTGMAGPPLVIYLACIKLKPEIIRATCVFFFLTSNFTALSGLLMSGAPLGDAALNAFYLLPALAAGIVGGNLAFDHVSPKLFRKLIFSMLIFSCLYTIGSILIK